MIDYLETDEKTRACTETYVPQLADEVFKRLPQKMTVYWEYLNENTGRFWNIHPALIVHAPKGEAVTIDKDQNYETAREIATHVGQRLIQASLDWLCTDLKKKGLSTEFVQVTEEDQKLLRSFERSLRKIKKGFFNYLEQELSISEETFSLGHLNKFINHAAMRDYREPTVEELEWMEAMHFKRIAEAAAPAEEARKEKSRKKEVLISVLKPKEEKSEPGARILQDYIMSLA